MVASKDRRVIPAPDGQRQFAETQGVTCHVEILGIFEQIDKGDDAWMVESAQNMRLPGLMTDHVNSHSLSDVRVLVYEFDGDFDISLFIESGADKSESSLAELVDNVVSYRKVWVQNPPIEVLACVSR